MPFFLVFIILVSFYASIVLNFVKENMFFRNYDVKYIDFQVCILENFGFPKLCFPNDCFYNDMDLELGCTYDFAIYYKNSFLTRNSVPILPIRLTILDIKSRFDIIDSVDDNKLTYKYFCIDSLLEQYDVYQNVTIKDIFKKGISNMVLSSDLVNNIVKNDYQIHKGTIDLYLGYFKPLV